MAGLSDLFLNPLGLLGAATVIPLIILYIIRPDPPVIDLPTVKFLSKNPQQGGKRPIIETLRRNLLLLFQILALIIISTALASPYITVTKSATAENTVIVMDTSASMETKTGAGTRFDRAVSAAKSEVTSTTSVVVSATSTNAVVKQGSPKEARSALDSLTVAETGGDLRGAIARASSLVGQKGRIVVFSDFADNSDWKTAVETARAKNIKVLLKQFNDGGKNNVGIVGTSFGSGTVTATVKNFGKSVAEKQISLGEQTKEVTLSPGDVTNVGFKIPSGNKKIEMTPHDSFPLDDSAYIAGYSKRSIDVLLVTNDENRYLSTALSVMNDVNLDVKNPPVTSSSGYDIIVFSNVDEGRLLQSTINTARETVRNGGGVVIQAQKDLTNLRLDYGDLLLVDPSSQSGVAPNGVESSNDGIIEGIDFSVPEKYIKSKLKRGRSLVNTSQGSPLIAVGKLGNGRLAYYGYMKKGSNFKFNYLYPVFWKRMVYYLVGREDLSSINVKTGNTLTFSKPAKVDTPSGTRTAETLVMDKQGFYSVGQRRFSANLLNNPESDVSAKDVKNSGTESSSSGQDTKKIPRELTPFIALLGLAIIGAELGFMKYRGDI